MIVLRCIDRAIARLEGWLITLFLGLMVTLTFFQVILRALYTYVHVQWANQFMGALSWSGPFVRLLVLWLTFLGASLITGENRHIKIDIMSSLLPPGWLPFRELILSLACALVCGFMVRASMDYIDLEMTFGGHLFLGLPAWVGQIILPAGFAMILFRFLLRGIEQGITLWRGDGA
jgi:TRAP-type C4-dicarboxylate transport system permease small subunit